TYDFRADGTGIFIASGGTSTFLNAGTVRKTAGSDVAALSVAYFYNLFTGLVEVQTGTLNLTAGGASTGTFQADANATLNFIGTPYTFSTGTTLTGPGSTQIIGGTVAINGSVYAQNLAVSGTLKLDTNAA